MQRTALMVRLRLRVFDGSARAFRKESFRLLEFVERRLCSCEFWVQAQRGFICGSCRRAVALRFMNHSHTPVCSGDGRCSAFVRRLEESVECRLRSIEIRSGDGTDPANLIERSPVVWRAT